MGYSVSYNYTHLSNTHANFALNETLNIELL